MIRLFDNLDNSSAGVVGAGGQLNYYNATLKKFVLFMPLETLPSVSGSVSTVDNDVTTSRTVGKIEGKTTLESKDATFLWTKENLSILHKYLGETMEFLVSYANGTGIKFTATYTYRVDDAAANDAVTGTITFVPSNVDETATLDVYDLMAKTATFANKFNDIYDIDTTGNIKVSLKGNVANTTFTAKSNNTAITANVVADELTISTTNATSGTSALVEITASATGCQPWTTLVTVLVK